jgi:hypothetical protein
VGALAARQAASALFGLRHRLLLGALIIAGLLVRVVALDRLPGINGDEAWYGVNVHLLLDGEPVFLRTGVGNVLSPLHSGFLVPLEAVAGPAFVLLRVPSVVWGTLALLLVFPLLARCIGTSAAVISASWLAVSPAAVSQARFGWDPSATLLLSLLVTGLALQGRWLAVLAFMVGLIVHPTNVFLAPLAATAWIPGAVEWYRDLSARARRWLLAITLTLSPFVAVPAFFLARRIAHAGFLPSIEMVVERLTSPALWYATATGIVSLLAGVTSATAIAGPPPAVLRIAAMGVIAVALAGAAYGHWHARHHPAASSTRWFGPAVATCILLFHVVAGPRALQPGVERYAMFVLVPLTVWCTWGLQLTRRGTYLAGTAATTLAAVLMLGYFIPLATRGGDGHSAFRTGDVEPKQAAFDFIRQHGRSASVIVILAEDWWLYWPLRYLAVEDRRIHVDILSQDHVKWLHPGTTAPPLPQLPDAVYAVLFAGSPRSFGNDAAVFTARDPIGRPIVQVFALSLETYAGLRRNSQ